MTQAKARRREHVRGSEESSGEEVVLLQTSGSIQAQTACSVTEPLPHCYQGWFHLFLSISDKNSTLLGLQSVPKYPYAFETFFIVWSYWLNIHRVIEFALKSDENESALRNWQICLTDYSFQSEWSVHLVSEWNGAQVSDILLLFALWLKFFAVILVSKPSEGAGNFWGDWTLLTLHEKYPIFISLQIGIHTVFDSSINTL